MQETELLTIGELAEQARVTPRTIRYYTAEGLLPAPDMRGKYALYGQEHLRRLELIRRLKEAFLPLNEIRLRLAQLSDEDVRRLLAEDPEGGPVRGERQQQELIDELIADEAEEAPSTSAADYITRVLSTRLPGKLAEPAPPAYRPPPPASAPPPAPKAEPAPAAAASEEREELALREDTLDLSLSDEDETQEPQAREARKRAPADEAAKKPAPAPSTPPPAPAPVAPAPSIPQRPTASTATRGASPGQLLRKLLPGALRQRAAPSGEQAAPERWERHELAPGVELHVREAEGAELRAEIETIIDDARELLAHKRRIP